jgi:hypothetical protein
MITDTLYEARASALLKAVHSWPPAGATAPGDLLQDFRGTVRVFLRLDQELKDYWGSIWARLERGLEGSACREVCRVALHVADAYAALGGAARQVLGMVTPQDRALLEQEDEGEAAVQAVFDAIDRFRTQVLEVQRAASRPVPPAPLEALRAAETGPFVRLKGD